MVVWSFTVNKQGLSFQRALKNYRLYLFILKLSFKYSWAPFIYVRNNQETSAPTVVVCFFVKKTMIYRSITSDVIGFRIKIFHSSFFSGLFSQKQGNEGNHFYSSLFVVLHLRRVPSNIKPSACNNQALV